MTYVDTTTRAHGIARALGGLGHGGHGGYFEAWHGIRCKCGADLGDQVEAALEQERRQRQEAAA